MIEKNAKTLEEINPLIAKRWSPRAFDINKKVSDEHIISLCEAARWAPSCNGDEPWKFIVFNKFSAPQSYDDAFDCIGVWNQKWIKNAPILFAVLFDTKFRKNGEINKWAAFDTGSACQNIYLQAFSDGLITHPIAGFDADKFRVKFAIPEKIEIIAIIAIGYQAEIDVLDSNYHKAELTNRTRQPLNLNFFKNSWENPIIKDIA